MHRAHCLGGADNVRPQKRSDRTPHGIHRVPHGEGVCQTLRRGDLAFVALPNDRDRSDIRCRYANLCIGDGSIGIGSEAIASEVAEPVIVSTLIVSRRRQRHLVDPVILSARYVNGTLADRISEI